MFRPILAVIIITLVIPMAGAYAGSQNQGGALNMPSMDVFDYKSVIIRDSKGGTTIGSYDRTTGDFRLFGPDNKITIGRQDGQGNMTINEYGGDDDD